MNQVFQQITEMRQRNARHRRGVYMQDMTVNSLLVRAFEELEELENEPGDIYELADVMAVLFHYAIVQGWTLEQLEVAISRKLALRFD